MIADESIYDGRLHNTLRFDVQLAYVQPMIDDGDVTVQQIAAAIRDAIEQAVNATVGAGLDGRPIPGGALIESFPNSEMLHRERIIFDLS